MQPELTPSQLAFKDLVWNSERNTVSIAAKGDKLNFPPFLLANDCVLICTISGIFLLLGPSVCPTKTSLGQS